jgi:hypothetical protein
VPSFKGLREVRVQFQLSYEMGGVVGMFWNRQGNGEIDSFSGIRHGVTLVRIITYYPMSSSKP